MKICNLNNCQVNHYAKGLCQRHYVYFKKNGHHNEEPSLRAPRPAKIVGLIAYIPLGRDAKGGYTMVDREYAYLDKYKWSINAKGYASGYVDGGFTRLHKLILPNNNKKLFIDHINRDKLDNRKANLRLLTPHESAINVSVHKNSTSGVRGVIWDKRTASWQVNICNNNEHIFLGRYKSLQKATAVRHKAELKYWSQES